MAVIRQESRNPRAREFAGLYQPDPFRPANLYRFHSKAQGNAGKRWVNFQERRSTIFAEARRLMTDTGFDGLCLRDIAERCNISVPTIYNIAGDRATVMHESAAEWVDWLGTVALAEDESGNKVLGLLAYFWQSGIVHQEYTKTAVRTSNQLVRDAFHKSGLTQVTRCLTELQAAQRLRPTVQVESLARQLVLSTNAGVCNWALTSFEPARYWRDFVNGPGLMLLGAVAGPEVAVIEEGLEALAAKYVEH